MLFATLLTLAAPAVSYGFHVNRVPSAVTTNVDLNSIRSQRINSMSLYSDVGTSSTQGDTSEDSAVAQFSVSDPVTVSADENTAAQEEGLEIDFDELSKESAKQAFTSSIDLSSMEVKTPRRAPRQAKWFPMLLSPAGLDGTYAGDVGFDPLGFTGGNKEGAVRMREAEVKHARLAMLAAAGWPMSELWHKEIADALGLDSILAEADKAPSVLNGGLSNTWVIATGVISLVVGGLLELRTFAEKEKEGYMPGDMGFDPLGLHGIRGSFGLDKVMETKTPEEKAAEARKDMELCEIKHGRLAMLAITGYAAQEFVTGIPVVQQTPFFFGDPIV